MDNKQMLEALFDKKTLTILKLFYQNREQEYGIRELAKAAKVPLATTHRIAQKLVQLQLIQAKKIKSLKLYSFMQNEHTIFLEPILEDRRSALSEFVKQASELPEVLTIVLHGKEEKDKASLLIIGKNVNQTRIKEIIVDIKKKYSFSIAHLALAPDQFDQMSAMGLYPGKKVILYEK